MRVTIQRKGSRKGWYVTCSPTYIRSSAPPHTHVLSPLHVLLYYIRPLLYYTRPLLYLYVPTNVYHF